MFTAGCDALVAAAWAACGCMEALGVGSKLASGWSANFPAAAMARAEGSIEAGLFSSAAVASLDLYEGSRNTKSVAEEATWADFTASAGAATASAGWLATTSFLATAGDTARATGALEAAGVTSLAIALAAFSAVCNFKMSL